MGLTIHYKFKFEGSREDALKKLESLRQAAMDLPFESVDPKVLRFTGKATDYTKDPKDSEHRWLKIQASESLYLDARGRHSDRNDPNSIRMSCGVPPTDILGFSTWPGEGCESCEVMLCRYPTTIMTSFGRRRTNLGKGWSGRGFCKTQYASNPKLGGVPHFLRCHLSVIALLDTAGKLGILDSVSDEGDFYARRDVKALGEEVGGWNSMLAGLVGTLDDALTGDGMSSTSEITKFPNFEHLEAAAQDTPEVARLRELITRVTSEHGRVAV